MGNDLMVTIDREGAGWMVWIAARGKVQSFFCPDETMAARFASLFGVAHSR
jgi:hypothetical protein